MSDFFETMHTLVLVEDLDLPTVPASEIRRRGDQLRRRRIALQTLVAASVVAVVAWGTAIGGWSHGRG
ncbi:MAG TPA: hypothetical protein VFK52_04570 [Nocardioidaceae bacterium]|nr:hypothetical protein [Nocardioidaceae bacterium]